MNFDISSFVWIFVFIFVLAFLAIFSIPGKSLKEVKEELSVKQYEVNGTKYVCPGRYSFDSKTKTCSIPAKVVSQK